MSVQVRSCRHEGLVPAITSYFPAGAYGMEASDKRGQDELGWSTTRSAMGKRRIETEIDIHAPAAKVWAVLTDFPHMALWNPFMTVTAGEPATGARLTITVRPPGKPAITLRPTLLAVRPERELRWLGHFIISGIFDGEHYFLLDPLGEDRTRLTHGESFSGLLVGLFGATLDATETGFNDMNAALKRQAEWSLA
jgi:hypothetical protein